MHNLSGPLPPLALLLATSLGAWASCTASHSEERTVLRVEGERSTFVLLLEPSVPDASHATLRRGAEVFADRLYSDVEIRLRLLFARIPTRGQCIPNGVRNFEGAPERDVWYPSSLADAIAATDHQPDHVDMEITFSSTTPWDFEVDDEIPSGESDLLSIALHEMAHGLGFFSTLRVEDGRGYYGHFDRSLFENVSFPVPELEERPGVYDLWIVDADGRRVFDHDRFANGSIELGEQLLRKENYFSAPHTVASNGEPLLLNPGSPSHVDLDRFRSDALRNLMIPSELGRDSVTHDPGPVVFSVLRDIGWRID